MSEKEKYSPLALCFASNYQERLDRELQFLALERHDHSILDNCDFCMTMLDLDLLFIRFASPQIAIPEQAESKK